MFTRMPFDWHTTYTVRLDLVPQQWISPTLASKILFCGKATLLLRYLGEVRTLFPPSTNEEGGGSSTAPHCAAWITEAQSYERQGWTEVYSYFLSSWHAYERAGNEPPPGSASHAQSEVWLRDVFDPLELQFVYDRFVELDRALKPAEEDREEAPLSNQLLIAKELFETLIEAIHNTLSKKLWWFLHHKMHFHQFIVGIRNTYLLGKGEFFQLIFDQALSSICEGQTGSSRGQGMASAQARVRLQCYSVLRTAADLLRLDEEALETIVQFHLHRAAVTIGSNQPLLTTAETRHGEEESSSARVKRMLEEAIRRTKEESVIEWAQECFLSAHARAEQGALVFGVRWDKEVASHGWLVERLWRECTGTATMANILPPEPSPSVSPQPSHAMQYYSAMMQFRSRKPVTKGFFTRFRWSVDLGGWRSFLVHDSAKSSSWADGVSSTLCLGSLELCLTENEFIPLPKEPLYLEQLPPVTSSTTILPLPKNGLVLCLMLVGT